MRQGKEIPMKVRKKVLSLFMVLALIVTMVPFSALAANAPSPAGNIPFTVQTVTPRAVNEYQLNHSGKYPTSIIIHKDGFTLNGIPGDSSYNYIWLQMFRPNGEQVYDEIVPRSASGDARFVISGLAAGQYRTEFYRAPEHYTQYKGFLDPIAEYKDGSWSILDSPVYQRNTSASFKESVSEAALAFFRRPERDIQSGDAQIKAVANSVTSGVSGDYAKALALHDWVCDNIYYDYDAFYNRTAYSDTSAKGVLASKRSVCEGYANLLTALLRASGIPAKKVSGYALGISAGDDFPSAVIQGTGDTNHSWTEAYVGGRWIIIDATWDSDNEYENGRITSNGGCYQHRYFDIGPELFALDHATLENPCYGSIKLYLNYWQMMTKDGWKTLSDDSHKVTAQRKNGWTTVPIGAVIWAMGGTTRWNIKSGYYDELVIEVGGHHAQVFVGYNKFFVDGRTYQFDVSPYRVKGYTLVQIAALFEAMDYTATWEGAQDNWSDGRITLQYAA